MAAWQDPENFARWLAIVLVVGGALISLLFIVTHLYVRRLLEEEHKLQAASVAHQQALLQTSVQVQERERARMAADLHDHLLSQINVALLSVHTEQPKEAVVELLERSADLTRRISHDLHPPLLEETTFIELLEIFLTSLHTSLEVRFTHALAPNALPLDNDSKLQLFRLVQEVIQNTLKHAQATCLYVHVHLGSRWLGLQVLDDGIGFEARSTQRGLGTKNIALRADLLHGQGRYQSTLGQGTLFSFYKPYTNL